MIIFLANFIYSDDLSALMRKHYGRPIVCHLRWARTAVAEACAPRMLEEGDVTLNMAA